MAVKSIIDIEVNDAGFKAFKDLFDKYTASLSKTGGLWADSLAPVEAMKKVHDGIVAALSTQTSLLTDAIKSQEKMADTTTTVGRSMTTLAKSSASVATNILAATRSLLKWTGILSAFSGLLGAGGLWGIERMASSAGAQRRTAQGLDTTPGGQNAFKINYGRFVDPDAFLGNVNTVMHDQSQQYALWAAGLKPEDIKGRSTDEVAAMLIPLLKKRFEQSGKTTQGMQAYGLDKFGSLDDFVRLSNTPDADLTRAHKDFDRDKKDLAVSDPLMKQWQDFTNQLKRAGTEIENVFITGLAGLEPGLEALSRGITHALKGLLGNPHMKEWIDDFGKALERFGNYLGGDKFDKDMKRLGDGIAELAEKIYKGLQWLGIIDPDKKPATGGDNDTGSPASPGNPTAPVPDQYDTPTGEPPNQKPVDKNAPWYWRLQPWRWGLTPTGGHDPTGRRADGLQNASYMPWEPGGNPSSTAKGAGSVDFASLERKNALPGGLLDGVWSAESGRGQHMVSPAGALGHFQFMPKTAQEYGLSNPFDLRESAMAAAKKLGHLIALFAGDIRKAVASYNWGEGNVKKDVERYGNDWERHLPAATRAYIPKVLAGVENVGRRVVIDIRNNTGGSAIISSSQLAV